MAERAGLGIADQGFFFVGGEYADGPNGRVMRGQMWVQCQVPVRRTHPWPVIMIHGLGQTGANFLCTPDGRPGWAENFLANGFSVYVVDQVGRGRSGSHPEFYGPYSRWPVEQVESLFTAPALHNLWPQAERHSQWPGGPGRPGNPSFDQFYASNVASIADPLKTEELMLNAGLALLEKTGPAILITHSQSGVFGWKWADERPSLVKAIIAVEPNGPPFFDVEMTGGAQWWRQSGDEPRRPWGATRLPLHFDPPANTAAELAIEQQETPDEPDLIRCWLQQQPARQLPNLKNIPVAIVTGEASYRAAYDHCTAAFLAQAGVDVEHIRLEQRGLQGNGHMMMLETNSREIAQLLMEWLVARGVA